MEEVETKNLLNDAMAGCQIDVFIILKVEYHNKKGLNTTEEY